MQINFIKIILDEKKSYKYQPIKYCCHKMWGNLSNPTNSAVFFSPSIHASNNSTDSLDAAPRIGIRKMQENGLIEDEIRYCPYCGKKITVEIEEEWDFSKSYRNLIRLKRRAAKRKKILQESDDLIEYTNRLLECFSCFEEIQDYSEQITALHSESVQLHKIWKQLEDNNPYKEHISDVLRTNKIFIYYMRRLNKNLTK